MVLKPSTENNIILFGGSFPEIRPDKSRFTRKQTVQSAAAFNSVHSNKVTLARATGANSFSLSVKQKHGRVLTFNHDSSGSGAPRRTEQLLTTNVIVHGFNWNGRRAAVGRSVPIQSPASLQGGKLHRATRNISAFQNKASFQETSLTRSLKLKHSTGDVW